MHILGVNEIWDIKLPRKKQTNSHLLKDHFTFQKLISP